MHLITTYDIEIIKLNAMLKKNILFLLMLVLGGGLMAQQTITGVVTDPGKEGIPGVSILIKGTTSGTITQVDGSYSLSANEDAVLVFSFIGYDSQEVQVNGRSLINITMASSFTDLDEVVVVGYGVQKKKLVTGATAHVRGDVLESRNVTSPLQALQGQAAGVNIVSRSGQPGEGMRVTIRGLGTIGNAGPLYIVDGVTTGGIDHLSPTDIESIDVLKDAASAAIYGSRAANGVVLVTTKKGKVGHAQISFDAFYGLQNVPKKIEMLNARDYGMIINEQWVNSGGSPTQLPFDVNNLPAYTKNGVANTNWMDEMFVENAVMENYSISATGGTEQTTYSMSLSYTGHEGIVGGKNLSNYERYNARFNSENKLYDGRVRIGQNLTLSYVEKNGVQVGDQYGNSLRGAFNVSPLLPMYDDNGNFFNTASKEIVDQNNNTYWNDQEVNPYAMMVMGNQNLENQQKVIGDVYAEIDIFSGLKFRTTLGVDFNTSERRVYTPIYQLSLFEEEKFDKASQRMSKNLAWNFDNILSYDLTVGDNKFDFMTGMATRQYNGSWMYGSNSDIAFNSFEHSWLDNATNQEWAKLSLEGAPDAEDKLLSYFGRVQYNYAETYMVNTTFRADGSSKFAKSNRWGYFPSVSLGWVLTNEAFMENMVGYVNFLKFRASWGQNGNQSISAFQYMAPIKFTQATYAFGDEEGVSTNGAYPNRLANENVKWETSEQLNFGFDANFLNNALVVNFDWYKKSTIDWLVIAPISATAGTDAPYINGGNVVNTGVELALSYNRQFRDFNYSVSVNGAYNINEVQNIPTEDGIIHGIPNSLYANSGEFYRAATGYPIGYFWGLKTDGLFQTIAEVQSHVNSEGRVIQPSARPGDVRYVDQDGDGRITDTDKVMVGNPNPDFIYGMSFSCNYKAFDFYFNANGVHGNDIVQSYRNHTNRHSNYTTAILDRWTGPGTSNKIPRVTNGNVNYIQFSDLFVQDGSYLRLSNVTIGFDVAKVMDMRAFSKFRVYASVQNLYTFTSYNGMDPEIGYGFDNGETDKFSSGIDLGFYPNPRTVLFGVNVNF
jgi:TonB-dependent starch-binding outer membrane protein SusC